MRMHVEALFSHDSAGCMTVVNETRGAAAPRFFIGRTTKGSLARFRHDLSTDIRHSLAAVRAAEPVGNEYLEPPYHTSDFEAVLAKSAPIENVWTGPAYRFPADLSDRGDAVLVTTETAQVLAPYLEDWMGDVGEAPFAAVLEDGRAVSICTSVRITPEAHEAGVETHEDFRGRGYARKAVTAWAAAVRASGVTPLYSTSWANLASQSVARRLGLVRFGADLHIR